MIIWSSVRAILLVKFSFYKRSKNVFCLLFDRADSSFVEKQFRSKDDKTDVVQMHYHSLLRDTSRVCFFSGILRTKSKVWKASVVLAYYSLRDVFESRKQGKNFMFQMFEGSF